MGRANNLPSPQDKRFVEIVVIICRFKTACKQTDGIVGTSCRYCTLLR